MKFDVLALILDDNSAFMKNRIAFSSVKSNYSHSDSTVVIIYANNSVDRIVAGIESKDISSLPMFSGRKTKVNGIKEVMTWIIEAQCTRDAEGKSAKKVGILVDFDTFKHGILLSRLKAESGITVIEAITPKQVATVPHVPTQRQKTWRDFKRAFIGVAIMSLIIGVVLGRVGLYSNVRAINVDESDIALELGKTYQLTSRILPKTAVANGLTYESSNDNIATVSEAGLITATAEGNEGKDRLAKITVTSNDRKCFVIPITVKDSYHTYNSENSIGYGGFTTVPIIFNNTVRRCTGFTFQYCIYQIEKGTYRDFVGEDFLVLGRSNDDDAWKQLGTFTYGTSGGEITVDLKFPEIDLSQVICVIDGSPRWSNLTFNSSAKVFGLQYVE